MPHTMSALQRFLNLLLLFFGHLAPPFVLYYGTRLAVAGFTDEGGAATESDSGTKTQKPRKANKAVPDGQLKHGLHQEITTEAVVGDSPYLMHCSRAEK